MAPRLRARGHGKKCTSLSASPPLGQIKILETPVPTRPLRSHLNHEKQTSRSMARTARRKRASDRHIVPQPLAEDVQEKSQAYIDHVVQHLEASFNSVYHEFEVNTARGNFIKLQRFRRDIAAYHEQISGSLSDIRFAVAASANPVERTEITLGQVMDNLHSHITDNATEAGQLQHRLSAVNAEIDKHCAHLETMIMSEMKHDFFGPGSRSDDKRGMAQMISDSMRESRDSAATTEEELKAKAIAYTEGLRRLQEQLLPGVDDF